MGHAMRFNDQGIFFKCKAVEFVQQAALAQACLAHQTNGTARATHGVIKDRLKRGQLQLAAHQGGKPQDTRCVKAVAH